jgi:hypothetical protein
MLHFKLMIRMLPRELILALRVKSFHSNHFKPFQSFLEVILLFRILPLTTPLSEYSISES